MPPQGSPFVDRFYYLILPAIPLMFLELGYIARMARVGTVQVLEQPYIRTAVLKGLPSRRVIFGHVLRNAMVPTVTVIGSQVGWLIGGLVVIETLFVYPGIGQLHGRTRRQIHDVPMLEACVLVVAVHLHVLQPDRRHRRGAAQPAHPQGGLRWTLETHGPDLTAIPDCDLDRAAGRRRGRSRGAWSCRPTRRPPSSSAGSGATSSGRCCAARPS